MLTETQLENRKNGIGGSDAAVICGLSSYKTPRQLWAEKVSGETQQVDSFAIRFGNYFEPFLISEYETLNNVKVLRPTETFHHKDFPFLIAHIDGITEDGKIIEAKTTNSIGIAKQFEDDTIPSHYIMQCLHYCLVLDKQEVDVIALINGNLKVYTYKRDMEEERKYLERALEFWDCVKYKVMPDAIDFKEAINDKKNDESVTYDEEAVCLASLIKEKNKVISTLEKEVETLKKDLIIKMQDASTVCTISGDKVAAISNVNRKALDQDAIKAIIPNIDTYYKTSSFKQLRFY